MANSVRLTRHDPPWARLYAREGRRLRVALGSTIRGIEHIGSTAVPHLGTRPSIDILLGTDPPAAETGLEDALAALGYYSLGCSECGTRRFWRGVSQSPLEFEVRAVPFDGPDWHRYLAVRDYFRAHPADAALFRELKLATAPWGEAIFKGAKATFFAAMRLDDVDPAR